jgi:hypothetical protein
MAPLSASNRGGDGFGEITPHKSASVHEYARSNLRYLPDLPGKSVGENRGFLEGPTHMYRCTRTVPKHIELEVLGLALSEKQIPQIVENN